MVLQSAQPRTLLRDAITPRVHATDDPEHSDGREVRLAAERLLATHLHPGQPRHTYWAEVVVLDLTGAHLQDPELSYCRLPPATRFGGPSFAVELVWFTSDTDVDHRRRPSGDENGPACACAGFNRTS